VQLFAINNFSFHTRATRIAVAEDVIHAADTRSKFELLQIHRREHHLFAWVLYASSLPRNFPTFATARLKNGYPWTCAPILTAQCWLNS
jgi:hypothetical protein